MKYRVFLAALCAVSLFGCEEVLLTPVDEQEPGEEPAVLLEDVARVLSHVPLGGEQLDEVYDAARASAANGYDEEYRMQELFAEPGCGVGDVGGTKADTYSKPLRELLKEAVYATKASGGLEDPDAWLDALSASDIQIYWPFSDQWNGDAKPVITFDPGGDATQNEGYILEADGSVTKVLVTEEMAREQPVWVVNRNSDADYKTLEMLRREDPDWGQGGGSLVVTKGDAPLRTLVLRSLKARRNFDSWLAGAAELFVKMAKVENFKASTEAELRLYDPAITDFMVVVRRGQKGKEVELNTVLVSEWSEQLSSCGLMIIEDDGGTQTSWKCSAVVKYKSQSYGFEVDLPFRTRDDIVWRGSLTRSFVERNSGKPVNLGDVEVVLELI
jgi:hypothetical protein